MSDIPGKPAGAAAVADDPHRVMVVDDSAVIRGLLSRALEGDPELRVVASVGDGQMAINALTRQSIDVIVLDIEMPVMDGLTATRQIRAEGRWSRLPILMLTAKAMPDDQERCLAAGANDYMAKPIDVDKLLSLVRVWMPR